MARLMGTMYLLVVKVVNVLELGETNATASKEFYKTLIPLSRMFGNNI